MKNNKKISIAIVFGGRSAEHDVSVISARNIVKAINKSKYEISLVGINKKGEWLSFENQEFLSGKELFLEKEKKTLVIPYTQDEKFFIKIGETNKLIDVVFPILHGPFGEDGTIQGLFKLFNVPFVGPSVLGSAVGMDKDVSKRLMKEAGLPVSKFMVFRSEQKKDISFDKIKKNLGLPIFVKPANLGSSVGISKVENKREFAIAIKKAFIYDNKIIIEESVRGKEIECSIMGNEKPTASTIGEIIPNHNFYSYEAKYIDKDGATTAIPARISKKITKEIQKMAIKVFKVLCCEGMGRVDFFLTNEGRIFVNEINTIPGFTSISMYPKLWEKSGISYAKLIDKLIALAIDRYAKERKLRNE